MATPAVTVAFPGVLKRGWTRAYEAGRASYVDIASTVRATGMKVVCRLAAAEARTATKSRMPRPGPMTGPASAAKTLSELSGSARPGPVVPEPTAIWAATAVAR